MIEAPLWTDSLFGCLRTGLNHDKYNVHCSEKVMYDRNVKLVIINGATLENVYIASSIDSFTCRGNTTTSPWFGLYKFAPPLYMC